MLEIPPQGNNLAVKCQVEWVDVPVQRSNFEMEYPKHSKHY